MAPAKPIEPEAFREFERTGWEKVSQEYHDYYSRVTRQTIEPLLDAVDSGPGHRVLDVATGPGYGAAAAADRGAHGVGLDFSEPQIVMAKEQFPNAEFHVGDAEDLPFPDGDFDAVIMNFGILHFPRPEVAVAEAFRVLKPGGRLAFAVWATSKISMAFRVIERALKAHGNLDLPIPGGPHPYRFSDPDECAQVLSAAGFENPASELVHTVWRLPSPDALYEAVSTAGVRMTSVLELQTPDALDRIRTQMREDCTAYLKGDGIEIPMAALLSSATKP